MHFWLLFEKKAEAKYVKYGVVLSVLVSFCRLKFTVCCDNVFIYLLVPKGLKIVAKFSWNLPKRHGCQWSRGRWIRIYKAMIMVRRGWIINQSDYFGARRTKVDFIAFCQCPLCLEPLEIDDVNFYPCTCGYQVSFKTNVVIAICFPVMTCLCVWIGKSTNYRSFLYRF